LKELDIEQEYVQIVDYTYEITKALRVITSDSSLYIENNHKGFNDEQEEDLEDLSKKVTNMYKTFIDMMERNDYSGFATIINIRDEIIEQCAKLTKKQIRRVKDKESGTRNSILFMNILNETKTIVLQSVNLMKSQRNMILTVKKISEEETEKKN
jgi:Na+/phosphate symporter